MRIQFNIKSLQDITAVIIWFSLLAATMVYFIFLFYVVPWGDDFIFKKEAMDSGLFQTTVNFYKNWGGRYVGPFLIGLCGTFTHSIFEIIYWDRVVVILNFLLSLISFSVFIRTISMQKISWIGTVKYSLLFNTLLCVEVPDIFYYFYWSDTAINYTFGTSLMLLLFSYLIYLSFQNHHGTTWPVFFLVFVICGTNEIVIIATGLFLMLGIFLCKIHTGYINMLWVKIFATFVFFTLFDFLAPGNFARIAANESISNIHGSIMSWSLINFVKSNMLYYLGNWIFDMLLITSSILVFISVQTRKVSIFENIKFWHLCVSIFIWILLIPIFPLMSKYFLGLNFSRYWNLSYFFFILGWFVNISILKIILLNNRWLTNSCEKYQLIFTCLVSVLLLTNMKFLDATHDLIYNAAFMNDFFQERFKIILTSKSDVVKVPIFPVERMPRVIFNRFEELKPDSNCFVDCAYKEFFGKVIFTDDAILENYKCDPHICEIMKKNYHIKY